MKDLLPAIIGGFGGAAAAAGIGWAILRHFLRKTIDQCFGRAEQKFATELGLEHETAAELRHKQLSVYPSLSELIYRAKIGVDQLRSATTALELSNADITEACRELTTNLAGYRIYLSPDLFALVHRYKHILQDILVLADTYLRPEYLLDTVSEEIPLETRERISSMAQEVENLCDQIVEQLRQRMNRLAGRLSEEVQ